MARAESVRKLGICIIPRSTWFKNLRSELASEKWDEIRKKVYREAGYQCEICGQKGTDQGFRWPVECHEVWEFKKNIQKVVRLIALCPMCHKCQHPGLAQIQGFYEKVLDHYSEVNGINRQEAQNDFDKAFRLWDERNLVEWKLDMSLVLEGDKNE